MASRGRWLISLRRAQRDALPDVLEQDPLKVFRNARANGWTVSEASNLAAYLCGLPIADGSRGMRWTMKQVMAIRFYAWMVQEKRIEP